MDDKFLSTTPPWQYSYPKRVGCPNVWTIDGNSPIGLGVVGFVYKITRLSDGKFYIGKKGFWSNRKGKPPKGKKRAPRVITESNWKQYWGSSRELQEDLHKLGSDKFKREMLVICGSKYDMTFEELKLQLKYKVMNKKTNTYNGIINVRLRRRI